MAEASEGAVGGDGKPSQARLRQASRLSLAFAAWALVTSLLMAAGRLFRVDLLLSGVPGMPFAVPNTTIALLVATIGVLLARRGGRASRVVAGALASVVMAWAIVTLLTIGLRVDIGLDTALVQPLFGARELPFAYPARPAPETLLACLAFSLALLLTTLRRAEWAALFLTVVCGTFALLGLTGYVSAAPMFYSFLTTGLARGIALPTAWALTLLSAALLLMHPRAPSVALLLGDGPGSFLLRRLVLVAVLGPAIFGPLFLLVGAMAGFYDVHFRLALVVMAITVTFVALGWQTARQLELIDRSRRKSEEQVRASEALLRNVMENLPVGVWFTGREGRIVRGNPAAQRIWGGARYVKPTAYGEYKGWWADSGRAIAPDEWALARALRGETRVGEGVVIEGVDRVRRTILNSAAPLLGSDGAITGAVVVNEDITRRDRLERQQRFLARATRTLIEVTDYVHAVEEIPRIAVPEIADWSMLFLIEEERFVPSGWEYRASPNRALAEEAYRRLRPDPGALAGMAAVMRTGKPLLVREVTDDERRGLAQDEWDLAALRSLLASYLLVPLTGHTGVHGVLFCGLGESERRYAKEDVEYVQELANRCALSLENAKLIRDVRLAVSSRESLLAVVSHDLRSPLAAVRIGAEQLLRTEDAQGRVHGVAKRIRNAAERMERFIRDLLDFSKMEAGTYRIERREVAVHALLQSIEETFAPLAETRDLRFAVRGPPSAVSVLGSGDDLHRVLSNLVGNAFKFTPDGGSVGVEARREGDDLVVSVADTGPGISADEQAHIFERYWQASQTARSGAGLGLAIAKSIVEAHGGTIRVESAPGLGKTFEFTVPLAPQAARVVETGCDDLTDEPRP